MTNDHTESNKATAATRSDGPTKRFQKWGGGRVASVRGTHKWFADPVILIVKDIAVPVEQISEELPQVVVIRLLKEVQPPHIAQVGGHLFCSKSEHVVKWQKNENSNCEQNNSKDKENGWFYWPGKLSQSTSIGVARLVSPIFWYLSFKVSA